MSEIGKISGQILADDLRRDSKNLSFDTDLLHLDVVNRRIGVKNTGPTTGFNVTGTIAADELSVLAPNISPNFTTIGSLKFYTNTIQNAVGDINLTATGTTKYVKTKAWRSSDGLEFRGSDLQGTGTDQSINFYPTGNGQVIVGQLGTEKDVAVNGDLRTTGTLTFGGDVTFGNSDTDNVTFSSDINSSIRPEVWQLGDVGIGTNSPGDPKWGLGQSGYTWNNLYSKNVTATNASFSGALNYGTIDLSLKQGKSWYVSVNGSDTNTGDHQQGPYLTIAKALDEAQSGDTIFVFPGTYVEVTPLTVPVGVTVRGLDLRNVIITPSVGTISNDVFLLNGETTLEDFTVTGFKYNSSLNTGHAFRFANDFKVTSRSPYVKNITVITFGSITTSTDPRGYASGDAGRAAYIDGAVVNTASKEASLLFHSCTFLTPGVDCVTMTNGVRVEWLNSFTYFAYRGLVGLQGTLGFASLGAKFGAELRSIGSANVYGDWAVWGDGADVIMYLVGHNFAYVGSLQDSSNDPTLANEGHDAERLNGAEIYYQSVDQSGNMRIGNVFKVNSETGIVTFTGTNFQINQGSIEFISSSSRTYIDAHEVSTGNIRISDNTITTLNGNLNFSAANQNVNISSISEFILPKGSNTDPFNTVGGVRYNTTINNFEGYAATGVVSLYAIQDSTQTTRITPELTPGANDQTIRMYANNDLKISITDSKVTFKDLRLSNLYFTPARLTLNASSDLTFNPTSGITNIQNLKFYTDTIENISDDFILNLPQNNDGYFVLDGPAVQLPYGTEGERSQVPEVGMHRYNTDNTAVEVWDGTEWSSATGSALVSTEDMQDESTLWAYVLG
jgi:hypothetical protein